MACIGPASIRVWTQQITNIGRYVEPPLGSRRVCDPREEAAPRDIV